MEEIKIQEAWEKIKPERVVLVVSVDEKGKPNVMPAGWCMRCSFDPPLIAVSIGKTRYTHSLLKKSKEFVIAVPNKELIDLVKFTGSCSGRDVDKFKEAEIETAKGKGSVSLIKKATLNLECEKYNECDSGDHTIFIGKIICAWYNKKGVLFNFGKGNFREI